MSTGLENTFEIWNPASYVENAERSLRPETREQLNKAVATTLMGELTNRYLTRGKTSVTLQPEKNQERYRGGTKYDIWGEMARIAEAQAQKDPLNLLMQEVGTSMFVADPETIKKLDKAVLNTLIQQVTGLLLKKIVESAAD